MQIAIPQTVGRAKAIKLHFHLLVSFLTVRRVVAQGKWKTVNIIIEESGELTPWTIRRALVLRQFPIVELRVVSVTQTSSDYRVCGLRFANAAFQIPSGGIVYFAPNNIIYL